MSDWSIHLDHYDPDERIAYTTAHQRIYRTRGKAKDFQCACGVQAIDWAYGYEDVNAITDQNGQVYSTNPAFYIAMCRACHNRFDWLRTTHCPRGHPYEGDNLFFSAKGHRRCRACQTIASQTRQLTEKQRLRRNELARYRYRIKMTGIPR